MTAPSTPTRHSIARRSNAPVARWRSRLLAGSLAAVALCGCGPGDLDGGLDPLGSSDGALINGQVDAGHPGVVALTFGGNPFCTGTLITPTVVLTAAHCLPPNVPGSYSSIDVFFGTYVGNGDYRNAISGWTNPAWNENELYEDIGLLRLQTPAPVEPIPMNTGNLQIAQDTILVGFGVTSENGSDSGVKRVGNAFINNLDPWVIVMGANPSSTCFGDSGGTTLINIGGVEHVAGVHSRADCNGESYDMRVDGYMNDIIAFIGQPDCGADNLCASGCPAPDPDCPCAGDGYCTGACPDNAADPDCDPNCVENGICATFCSQPDLDCDCSVNGWCNPLCQEVLGQDDFDCVPPECLADGVCNPSCAQDADCWSSGPAEDRDYSGTSFPLCSLPAATGGTEHDRGHGTWWLLGLGLWLVRRRR